MFFLYTSPCMIICARKADIGKTTFCKVFHQRIIMYRLPHFLLKGSFKLQDNWYSILWFALSRNGWATFPIFTALSSKCETLFASGIAHISITRACELDIGFGWNERSSADHALLKIFNKSFLWNLRNVLTSKLKYVVFELWCNQASLFDSLLIDWESWWSSAQLNC